MAPFTRHRPSDDSFNRDGYYEHGETYYRVDFKENDVNNPTITEWQFEDVEKYGSEESCCGECGRFNRLGNTEALPIHKKYHSVHVGDPLDSYFACLSFLNAEDLETRIYTAQMCAQRQPPTVKVLNYQSSLTNIPTNLGASLHINEETEIDSLNPQHDLPWVNLTRQPDRQLLETISSMQGLIGFMMPRSRVTLEIAESLLKIKSLQAVDFKGSSVSLAAWEALSAHPALCHVNAERVWIDEESARAIARFPRLQVLWLHAAQISDNAVVNLCQSDTLLKLTLHSTSVTGDFAADLSMSNVKDLNISHNPISPRAFRLLSESPELVYLIASVTEFDDQALGYFHNHPSLYTLSIGSTRCTLGGIKRMFEANQNCYVSF